MISFKAGYIHTTNIINTTQNKKQPVAFVELLPHSLNDGKTLENISRIWGKNAEYADDIFQNFQDSYSNLEESSRYFALTEAHSRYSKLNAKKVLGLIEISETQKQLFIDILQTNPNHMHKNSKRKFKNIGTALIDSVKQLIPQKEIILSADENAIPFYLKLGFIKNEKNSIMRLVR